MSNGLVRLRTVWQEYSTDGTILRGIPSIVFSDVSAPDLMTGEDYSPLGAVRYSVSIEHYFLTYLLPKVLLYRESFLQQLFGELYTPI